MKRSEMQALIRSLGCDPHDVLAVMLEPFSITVELAVRVDGSLVRTLDRSGPQTYTRSFPYEVEA